MSPQQRCYAEWGDHRCRLPLGHNDFHRTNPKEDTMPHEMTDATDARAELTQFDQARGLYRDLYRDPDTRIETFLQRNIVLPRETPADGEVTYDQPTACYVAGSGPEEARALGSSNPNWLRNKARNYLAIADHIEQEEARRDEERARKQEIARHHAKGLGTGVLASMTAAQQAIVDHIYDLERQVAAGIIAKVAGQ